MIPTPRKCVIPFLSTKVNVRLLAGNAFHLQRLIPLDFQRYQPTFVFAIVEAKSLGSHRNIRRDEKSQENKRVSGDVFFWGGVRDVVVEVI